MTVGSGDYLVNAKFCFCMGKVMQMNEGKT